MTIKITEIIDTNGAPLPLDVGHSHMIISGDNFNLVSAIARQLFDNRYWDLETKGGTWTYQHGHKGFVSTQPNIVLVCRPCFPTTPQTHGPVTVVRELTKELLTHKGGVLLDYQLTEPKDSEFGQDETVVNPFVLDWAALQPYAVVTSPKPVTWRAAVKYYTNLIIVGQGKENGQEYAIVSDGEDQYRFNFERV